MKKGLYLLNLILLIINGLTLILFSVSAVAGSEKCFNFITDGDIQIMLFAAIAFELIYIIISKIISVVLKVDLTYKGEDSFDFIPKSLIISAIIIGVVLIAVSIILNIHYGFIITVMIMLFSILLEFGITMEFKNAVNG